MQGTTDSAGPAPSKPPSIPVVGAPAPSIRLPSEPGKIEDLSAFIGVRPVILLFVPLAFSSVCTQAACQLRDNWGLWEGLGAEVFMISVDSPFVTARWRADERMPFKVLSDFNREVSEAYGCLHQVLAGLKGVAKRSAFVIGKDGKIAYRWVSEDPKVQVDFEKLQQAAEAACAK